jgi:hypothetical protein
MPCLYPHHPAFSPRSCQTSETANLENRTNWRIFD